MSLFFFLPGHEIRRLRPYHLLGITMSSGHHKKKQNAVQIPYIQGGILFGIFLLIFIGYLCAEKNSTFRMFLGFLSLAAGSLLTALILRALVVRHIDRQLTRREELAELVKSATKSTYRSSKPSEESGTTTAITVRTTKISDRTAMAKKSDVKDAWDPFSTETGKFDVFSMGSDGEGKKDVGASADSDTTKERVIPISERLVRTRESVKSLQPGAQTEVEIFGDADKDLQRMLGIIDRLLRFPQDDPDLQKQIDQGIFLLDSIARQSKATQIRIVFRTLILGGPESHWIASVHLPSVLELVKAAKPTQAHTILKNMQGLLAIINFQKRMEVIRLTDPVLPRPDVLVIHLPTVLTWKIGM